MKRPLLIGAAALGAAVLARRAARGCGFENLFERMPENGPPKWMFRNISTIRENTERILKLLETERMPTAGQAPARRPGPLGAAGHG